MTNDTAAWVETAKWLGALTAAGLAAFFAKLSDIRSRRAEEHTNNVNTQIMGPDNEPSIRELVKDNQSRASDQHMEIMQSVIKLHELLMSAVSRVTDVEDRMSKLEDNHTDLEMLNSAVASISKKMDEMEAELDRARFNIHHIANFVQTRIESREEFLNAKRDKDKEPGT